MILMSLAIKFLILALVVIFFLVVLGITNSVLSNVKYKNMINSTELALKQLIEDRKLTESATLKLALKKEYDFYFESRTHIYYIKVVPNFKNYEISVNNKTRWQIIDRKNDGKLKYVENISELMNYNITFASKKIVKKLYIIYPNAISLVKYINECELAFIYPDTDVYGCNIITYQNLKEHPEIIEAK